MKKGDRVKVKLQITGEIKEGTVIGYTKDNKYDVVLDGGYHATRFDEKRIVLLASSVDNYYNLSIDQEVFFPSMHNKDVLLKGVIVGLYPSLYTVLAVCKSTTGGYHIADTENIVISNPQDLVGEIKRQIGVLDKC